MPANRRSPHPGALRRIIGATLVLTIALSGIGCATATTTPGTGPYRQVLPSIARDSASGIQGLVTIGPTCPVERPQSPCPDRAYPTTIVVTDSSGVEVARVATDAAGQFQVSLGPGDYTITEVTSGIFPRPVSLPVHVAPDAYAFVHVMLDSGIR
ncbi:MAG TPA: hypothetical protein VIK11_10375 [Tepidiformaceae bacterium]|jgi:hypothetical protein